MSRALSKKELRVKIDEVQARIDAAYWTFTRCAKGQPVPGHLYTERTKLKAQLRELRKGRPT